MEKAFEFLQKKDPVFHTIIAQYGFPTIPIRPQGFTTLVLLILEQQVSVDSAKATFLKIKLHTANLNPETMLSLPDATFRSLGVSRQKTTYIKALASAIINNEIDLDHLPNLSASEVRETLIKIKGIGHWTIDVYLMFCLQSPDILPLGDVAVMHTIKELFDLDDKPQIALYTQNWQPHRSAATFLLWHYYLRKRNRTITYNP